MCLLTSEQRLQFSEKICASSSPKTSQKLFCLAFYALQRELFISTFINRTHFCITINITFAVKGAGQGPSLLVAAQFLLELIEEKLPT